LRNSKQNELAQRALVEADFVQRIAEGESVADAAAFTGLTELQGYQYLRNPLIAERVRDLTLARYNALLLPAAVNSLLRLMSPDNDDSLKRGPAQARAAAALVMAATRANGPGRPPKRAPNEVKTFEEMSPEELERHLATLRVTQGESKAME
jgi:uncharacterized membrane protein